MGRYRPPPPPQSNYITPEGVAVLENELDDLWRVQRPAVTRAVAEAAAQGDRSENAEYIYGKKQLAAIDRRVRHLRKRLSNAKVVDQESSDPTKVYFGAWFTLEADDGAVRRFRLVGPDEFDHATDYLSMDSPLGRAVLGKSLHDEITVNTPEGPVGYTVTQIAYTGPEDTDQA